MILVLPGTKWSEGLCKKVKEKGEKLLLVSPEEHPYCEKYADEFLRADIFETQRIADYCKKKMINAIMTDECDIAVPVVAELGKKLSVNTISEKTANLFTDKYLMREFSREYGIKCPEFRQCKTLNEAIQFYQDLQKDIIIKPLDSNASHGVFKVASVEDLRDHFDESLAFSRIEKEIIAESYINGPEFTIDGIKTPRGHFTLAISQKKHFRYNENIACELFFTHKGNGYNYDKLKEVNDSFVNRSGLEYGFTHAEYKYDNGDYYLIEIAARGGGNQISSIITQYMSGYDTYDYLIECALGRVQEKKFGISRKYEKRAAVLHFFHVPNGGGKVMGIQGEEFLKENLNVLDYGLNFNLGDEIHDAVNDSVRIGYYIAGEESEKSLRELQDEISKRFKIEVQ